MAAQNWADFLIKASTVVAGLVQAGKDAMPFAEAVIDSIRSGVTPTEADWAALKAQDTRLRDELHAPLPPEG